MSLFDWIKLNKRVERLEDLIQKIQQDNITLVSTPLLTPFIEKIEESEIIRGREIEEDLSNLDEETVEEREYREEKKWESQRKQKERLV